MPLTAHSSVTLTHLICYPLIAFPLLSFLQRYCFYVTFTLFTPRHATSCCSINYATQLPAGHLKITIPLHCTLYAHIISGHFYTLELVVLTELYFSHSYFFFPLHGHCSLHLVIFWTHLHTENFFLTNFPRLLHHIRLGLVRPPTPSASILPKPCHLHLLHLNRGASLWANSLQVMNCVWMSCHPPQLPHTASTPLLLR